MNEEAREKAWWRFSDARQAPRIADSEIFESGWDAARTFSAEDVERVAKVLANREMGKWDLYLDDARAALAAIGTVEEVQ